MRWEMWAEEGLQKILLACTQQNRSLHCNCKFRMQFDISVHFAAALFFFLLLSRRRVRERIVWHEWDVRHIERDKKINKLFFLIFSKSSMTCQSFPLHNTAQPFDLSADLNRQRLSLGRIVSIPVYLRRYQRSIFSTWVALEWTSMMSQKCHSMRLSDEMIERKIICCEFVWEKWNAHTKSDKLKLELIENEREREASSASSAS